MVCVWFSISESEYFLILLFYFKLKGKKNNNTEAWREVITEMHRRRQTWSLFEERHYMKTRLPTDPRFLSSTWLCFFWGLNSSSASDKYISFNSEAVSERGNAIFPFVRRQSIKQSELQLRRLRWEPPLRLMNTRKCEKMPECKPTADVFHMQIRRIPEGSAARTIWENVGLLQSRSARQRSEAGCGRCPWVLHRGGGTITPACYPVGAACLSHWELVLNLCSWPWHHLLSPISDG